MGGAVANLDHLFADAIRTHSGPNNKGAIHIRAMHRYYAPFIHNGEIAMAKMTVKEFAEVADGNRLYSVEALDIVKPAGNWVPSISEDRRNYTPQAGFEEKLQRKIDKIKGKTSLGSTMKHHHLDTLGGRCALAVIFAQHGREGSIFHFWM